MTPRPICFVLLLVAATPAAAEQGFIPTLHHVSGVAADDVLNVRSAPGASAAILGGLEPGQGGVEVTALDPSGRWGRIGMGEGDGWVAMAYLAADPWPEGIIPDGMTCLGTEPFWRIGFRGGSASVSAPDEVWPAVPVEAAATPVPPGRQGFGFDLAREGVRLSGVIEAGSCSDGMSDRHFGWRITLMRQSEGKMGLAHGCCTLDRR
ncbi:SH3 domain-containing protein [Tropicimonas sp. IMCC34043]|uniref:SH3 domain-containing protein n=1 Tax=Tropicimonas sp. IMCC34043 TaxID=2248760 RepID=UPI0013008E14|nr:SH3 domain-containing protein [Tropicimonas sp. IMCC34043]